jgi:hypothetical protein
MLKHLLSIFLELLGRLGLLDPLKKAVNELRRGKRRDIYHLLAGIILALHLFDNKLSMFAWVYLSLNLSFSEHDPLIFNPLVLFEDAKDLTCLVVIGFHQGFLVERVIELRGIKLIVHFLILLFLNLMDIVLFLFLFLVVLIQSRFCFPICAVKYLLLKAA